MDEPFSALDPVIRKGMQQELLHLQARVRKTVVFITHDLDEAVALGQQIAIVRDGRVVQLGSPADILLNPADDEVRLFVEDMDVSRVITAVHLAVPLGYIADPDEPPARALKTCRRLGLRHLIVGESGCPRRGVGVTELEARMTNGAPATLGGLRGHQPPPNEQMLTWPIDRVVVAGSSVEEALAPFRSLSPYEFMPAVRERRATLIAPYMLSSVTHHRVEGYECLARGLHPEVFK